MNPSKYHESEEVIDLLYWEELGTIGILDSCVFFKTSSGKTPYGDRWFSPRDHLLYNSVEFGEVLALYTKGAFVLI